MRHYTLHLHKVFLSGLKIILVSVQIVGESKILTKSDFFPKCVTPFFWNCLLEKPWLSATPDRPEALEKIRQLEASKGQILPTDLSAKKFGMPVFIEHLNDLNCVENENIKFKCKVEPKDDPTLQIGKTNNYVNAL